MVEDGGGRTVELRGDEALCVFDSPRQALRAAVALQRRFADAIREDPSLPLRVGIGLDAGEAVSIEDGYRGGALNLASRLCALAQPGEVLAGDGIVLMAGQVDGLGYSARGRVRVKGISNPVRVHRLEFELDLPAAPTTRKGRISRRTAFAGVGVALALIGAGVAALLVLGGTGGPSGVAGDSAALLDPQSGAVRSETAVGATPLDVVSNDETAWTLDGDAQTISRVSSAGGRALTKAPGFTPTALSLGGGELWSTYAERSPAGARVGVAALDPSTLTPRDQRLLPGIGPSFGENPPILYANGAVWASGPDDRLWQIDPVSQRINGSLSLRNSVVSLAAGLGSIWASSGRHLMRIDPTTREVTQRIRVPTPDIGPVAVGASSVWVGDSLSGTVWRIEPGPPVQMHTVTAGLSASGITFGQGAVWVASPVDGNVYRIDAESEEVRAFELGNAPVDVSVAPVGVWAAVTAGGGRTIEAAPKLEGLETLPAGTCDAAVYGGSGNPDHLIVGDLPMQALDAPVTLAMVQAIEFVLRQHGFRAGPYNLAFQPCDDATVPAASYTEEKCAANAKRYVATSSVIAVLGPFNSGCAEAQIPIANRARPGPLPMVSPTTSFLGLTREGGGTQGVLDKLYPTGIRNFARVYPADDVQGAADALLAKRLGVRNASIFLTDPEDAYALGLSDAFVKAARRLGLHVTAPVSRGSRDGYASFARRLRRMRVGGLFIAGLPDERTDALVRALRSEFGRDFVVIAPDSFLPASDARRVIGPAATGMYVSGGVVTEPLQQLPAEGQRFTRAFSATQRGRNVNFFAPYAAQATEVLLDAIARSDGTRASVARELFRVRLKNSIFGPFSLDRNGDPNTNLLPVFRAPARVPKGPYPHEPVYTVITVPAHLVR